MLQPKNTEPDTSPNRSPAPSRLNAQAPEFVPRGPALIHVYRPYNNQSRSRIGGGTQYFDPHHPRVDFDNVSVDPAPLLPVAPVLKNGLTLDAAHKIINQVEYYFSDINLATTDHLMRYINKEAEGYVPVSVVASFKKIKAVITNNSQLASILKDSTRLVVSEDGKKIRRKHPLTELDLEELQSRIIVAENLPEDHCHQNLMKIFSVVGSVKTIRTCQPQPSNGGTSSASRPGKADSMFVSNKLHAFVEYESVELAEKAVAELNDGANWRSGLRVRLLGRNNGKSAQPRGKKLEHESEGNGEEDGTSVMLMQPQISEKHTEDPSQQSSGQPRENVGQGEDHVNDKEGVMKKGRGRGKSKGRGGRGPPSHYHQHQYHNNPNNHHHQNRIGTPPSSSFEHQQTSVISKQPPGPRMPDGTRGFSFGRGKPLQIA